MFDNTEAICDHNEDKTMRMCIMITVHYKLHASVLHLMHVFT